VFVNIDEKRVRSVIEQLLGKISRVDIIERTNEKGEKYKRVFVHFEHWFETADAQTAKSRLIEGKEIKIVYDDPWFWKVSANKVSVITRPKQRLNLQHPTAKPPPRLEFDESREPQHPARQQHQDPRDYRQDPRDYRQQDPRDYRQQDPRDYRQDPRDYRQQDPRDYRQQDPRDYRDYNQDPRDHRQQDPRNHRHQDPRNYRQHQDPRGYNQDPRNYKQPIAVGLQAQSVPVVSAQLTAPVTVKDVKVNETKKFKKEPKVKEPKTKTKVVVKTQEDGEVAAGEETPAAQAKVAAETVATESQEEK
jgi:hypothetical protein